MNGWMDGWMIIRVMVVAVDGEDQRDGWMEEWMKGSMGDWMDGLMDG